MNVITETGVHIKFDIYVFVTMAIPVLSYNVSFI